MFLGAQFDRRFAFDSKNCKTIIFDDSSKTRLLKMWFTHSINPNSISELTIMICYRSTYLLSKENDALDDQPSILSGKAAKKNTIQLNDILRSST